MEFYAKDLFTSKMSAEQREQIFSTLKHITGIKKRFPVKQDKAPKPSVTPRRIEAVVIAASTGGPKALSQLCAELPKEFPVPVILVQHNTSGFDLGFAQWLNGFTGLNVCLAREKVVPVKGNFYVAPTDRHLVLTKTGFLLDDSPPIHNQKPAADLLFKSASLLYGESLLSVVLTGMGCDGADGTRYVKEAGGITIAQDEVSSMIYGMPQAAAETGCVDMSLSLDLIAQQLLFIIGGSRKV
jgi:two-component system chemotaxis response regulator CheB